MKPQKWEIYFIQQRKNYNILKNKLNGKAHEHMQKTVLLKNLIEGIK